MRGTTSRKIIEIARASGAKNVYFASTSPPLIAACPYGIDMATKKDFIAAGKTIEEVRNEIGADELCYLSLENLVESGCGGSKLVDEFCTGCFSGDYPTPDALEHLEALSAERASART